MIVKLELIFATVIVSLLFYSCNKKDDSSPTSQTTQPNSTISLPVTIVSKYYEQNPPNSTTWYGYNCLTTNEVGRTVTNVTYKVYAVQYGNPYTVTKTIASSLANNTSLSFTTATCPQINSIEVTAK